MDKFTKTTEIDISAMTEMEDETPKKSSVGKIVAMICCLVFAIIIWLFVMEIDTSIHEKQYDDISVQVCNNNDKYDILGIDNMKIDVVLTGINRELADINKEDIDIFLDISKIEQDIELGKQKSYPVVVQPKGAGETVQSAPISITVTIKEAQSVK